MGERRTHSIGIVGAGTIVQYAHLPAYRTLGLDVCAIYDSVAARAEALVQSWPGSRRMASVAELLSVRGIDVIDIAITPGDQMKVARAAIRVGKHLLCQKPLAPTIHGARELVSLAEAAGVKLAVNQQMRWEAIVATVKSGLEDGSIGRPVEAHIHTDLPIYLPAHHWLAKEPRFAAMFGTIHFLDAARYLLGEPAAVTARMPPHNFPGVRGETWVNAWLEWDDGSFLAIHDRHGNRAGDVIAFMRVEGPLGAIRGRFGIWDEYPHPKPDVVEKIDYKQGLWKVVSHDKSWIPDAFTGPISGLLAAIDSNSEPPTSGKDHLRTLELVEALYASSLQGRTVYPADVRTP